MHCRVITTYNHYQTPLFRRGFWDEKLRPQKPRNREAVRIKYVRCALQYLKIEFLEGARARDQQHRDKKYTGLTGNTGHDNTLLHYKSSSTRRFKVLLIYFTL